MTRLSPAVFLPRAQPWISRPSYRREMITSLTYPAAISMIEGGVIGIIALKTFNMQAMLYALISAAPMFANLTSFVWARLAAGRRKIAFITGLQLATLIAIASIALLPATTLGTYLLTANIILARCLIAGVTTIRSTVWRHNYPREARGQVTGRLAIIASLMMTVAPLAGSQLLELNADNFRILYPACAAIALIGTYSYAGVRMRRERELLRFERRASARPTPHGSPAPLYEYDPDSPRDTFWTVLKNDTFYRRYQAAQFIFGGANMAGEVVLIYAIAEMTEGNGGYSTAIVLTTVVPMVFAMISVPLWGRLFDKTHIATFRARQSPIWIVNQTLNWIGIGGGFLWLIAIARVLQGFARGGGLIAWNLGHNDFADRRLVAIYMGIHITLTGVRGAFCPFLGMALYTGWDPLGFGKTVLDWTGFEGMTHHVFLLSAILSSVGGYGFWRLSKDVAVSGAAHVED